MSMKNVKRSVIREVTEQPMNPAPQDGCWVHDTREPDCDLCETGANPKVYPETDAGILEYRADQLDVCRALAPDIDDDLARAQSAIRGVAARLQRPEITAEQWEAAARKAMAMYDWSKKETIAINDFILTVNDAAARILSEGTA